MHDLTVIGDDLSAHTAAAVAANYGLDTILMAEYGTGGVCLFGDFAFNVDPTPLNGLGVNQTCLSLLAELDIQPIEREGRLLNPAYQIILPEHRIDFFNEKEALISEMVREFPREAKEISIFYESVIKKCAVFSQWLRNHPYIRPVSLKDCYHYFKLLPHLLRHQADNARFKNLLKHNAALNKVFEAQEALLASNIGHQNSFSSSFQYCAPFRGIYRFPQGKQIIFNSLIEKLEANKGLYLSHCKILSIKTREKAVEIEVNDRTGNTTVISSKNLIVSTKWEKMVLLFAGKPMNLGDWISPVKVLYLPFTIHLGCTRKCVPEKMAYHLALVSDIQKNIFDDNLIILESNMPDNESIYPSDKLSMTATVFLPNNPQAWSRENLEVTASSTLARMEFFLPFLKENIELFDLDKSIELSKTSRSVFSPKYKINNSLISCFAARTNKTRFNNVFLTGGSLLTDAGFEGEIISGMNAAARVIAGGV